MILIGIIKLIERILIVRPELKSKVGQLDNHNLLIKTFNSCLFNMEDDQKKEVNIKK